MAYVSGSSQGPALAILKAVPSTMRVQEVWRTKLWEILREDLRGAYLSGSVALRGYVPGQSDIDLFAVCQHSLKVEEK
jgi:predicted nucleotidyltransferase